MVRAVRVGRVLDALVQQVVRVDWMSEGRGRRTCGLRDDEVVGPEQVDLHVTDLPAGRNHTDWRGHCNRFRGRHRNRRLSIASATATITARRCRSSRSSSNGAEYSLGNSLRGATASEHRDGGTWARHTGRGADGERGSDARQFVLQWLAHRKTRDARLEADLMHAKCARRRL